MEWYEVQYVADRPDFLKVDRLDESNPPQPSQTMAVTHARGASPVSKVGEVALDDLAEVRKLSGPGGAVALGSKSPLTIRRIERLLGAKLAAGPEPTIDAEEVSRYRTPPASGFPTLPALAGTATGAAIGIGLLVRWRRSREHRSGRT